jgi:hypothetical protein
MSSCCSAAGGPGHRSSGSHTCRHSHFASCCSSRRRQVSGKEAGGGDHVRVRHDRSNGSHCPGADGGGQRPTGAADAAWQHRHIRRQRSAVPGVPRDISHARSDCVLLGVTRPDTLGWKTAGCSLQAAGMVYMACSRSCKWFGARSGANARAGAEERAS